jgi:hypothetical protein
VYAKIKLIHIHDVRLDKQLDFHTGIRASSKYPHSMSCPWTQCQREAEHSQGWPASGIDTKHSPSSRVTWAMSLVQGFFLLF